MINSNPDPSLEWINSAGSGLVSAMKVLWAIAEVMGLIVFILVMLDRPTPDGFSIDARGKAGHHEHDHAQTWETRK
jgi:hypothetical protein